MRSREPRRRRGRKAVPPASGGPPPPAPPAPPARPTPPASREALAASEERFRALVEHSTEVITLLGPDGTVLYASQSAQPVLGYAYQENIGRKAFELIHPDDVAAAQAFLRQVAERPGEPQRTELRARHKNGSWRDLEAVAVNRLREPAIAAIVVTYRDVTERRRADRIQRATYRISEAAHRSETLHELFRAIHEIVGGLMPANNFYIALYDAESDIISFPYFVDQYDSDFPPKRPGKGLTEYVLRTGAPLLVTPEVHRELERRGYVELIGAPSIDWLGVPLTIGDNTIGVLVAQSYAEGVRYGETDKSILQFVSAQVAMAIDRKRGEERLRDSENRYRLLFESNPEAMWVYDAETLRFLAVNEAAVRHYGYSRQEFLALTIRDIRPPEEQDRLEAALQHAATGAATHVDARHRKKDGTFIQVEVSADSIDFDGRPARLVLAKDVTGRRRLEEQLRQAQKMEAIGQLAGGVAHDFNNLLTAILGYCQLLLQQLSPDAPAREDVFEIRRAGERAASLTQQLLAFSRKQVLQAQVLDVNVVVADMEKMLRRVIGEDLDFVTVLRHGVGRVKADPGQLEQVIINLAVNSRDAMPQGGRLTIETANAAVDEVGGPGQVPGRYVLISITDTGTGMDAETRSHLFEPFFTTKPVGKGTGLGLATVYGIVKQFGGYIWVDSEPQRGTTFRIYLPEVQEAAQEPGAAAASVAGNGSETVLLVEDETMVRTLARKALESHGYRVLEAGAAPAALELSERHVGPINLLLTDVVMPGMSGRELAHRLLEVRGTLRVLYMSGYTDDAVLRHGVLEEGMAYLQKPFTPDKLARKVREVLDAK